MGNLCSCCWGFQFAGLRRYGGERYHLYDIRGIETAFQDIGIHISHKHQSPRTIPGKSLELGIQSPRKQCRRNGRALFGSQMEEAWLRIEMGTPIGGAMPMINN